ncbi:MAG: 30S ribosomal protein S5 [Candidatus Moraniibacteriota bacterium]|nr:MAG: 30S ribosomal protein S5 [Candidatus Moranbacteria bacterium]
MVKKERKKGFKGKKRAKPEFDQQLLDLARVTRVVKGGRRFRFRATMVIGNRKGKVGVGVAKGTDVSQAIQKAVADAKKNMIEITLDGNTIAHDITYKRGSARVLLRPTKEGSGLIAGGAMRAIVELVGIRDVVAKSSGCSNKLNVARATVGALAALKKPKNTPQTQKDPVVKSEKGDEEKKSVTKKTTKKTATKKTVKKATKKATKKTATKKATTKVAKK